jgi:hypothetical protein
MRPGYNFGQPYVPPYRPFVYSPTPVYQYNNYGGGNNYVSPQLQQPLLAGVDSLEMFFTRNEDRNIYIEDSYDKDWNDNLSIYCCGFIVIPPVALALFIIL